MHTPPTSRLLLEKLEQQGSQAAQLESAVRPEYCSTALALGHAHHGPSRCNACCRGAGKLGRPRPHARCIVIAVTLMPALSTLQLIRRLNYSRLHARRLSSAADHFDTYPGDSSN